MDVVEALQTASIWTILTAVIINLLLGNSPTSWFDLFTKLRNRKLDALQTLLRENSTVSQETQALLQDILEAKALQQNVGFYAERKLRVPLTQLYDRTSHDIGWSTIRSALQHLEIEESEIRVRPMSGSRKWWWRLNLVAFAVFTSIMALCLLAALYLLGIADFDSAPLLAVQFGFMHSAMPSCYKGHV